MTLFETMRAEAGHVALLDRHLARLAASAAAFGLAYRDAEVRAALAEALAGTAPALVHRVRLTVGDVIAATAEPLAGAGFRTVWLCPDPLREAGGPLCIHKTTDRAHYETPFRAARAGGADEAILVNTRGEIVEGSRTSVWAEYDGRVWTPPLAAGGLPGVMRQWLLDTRPDAAEATLTPADLRAADALYVSNALRGLVSVRLSGS